MKPAGSLYLCFVIFSTEKLKKYWEFNNKSEIMWNEVEGWEKNSFSAELHVHMNMALGSIIDICYSS